MNERSIEKKLLLNMFRCGDNVQMRCGDTIKIDPAVKLCEYLKIRIDF